MIYSILAIIFGIVGFILTVMTGVRIERGNNIKLALFSIMTSLIPILALGMSSYFFGEVQTKGVVSKMPNIGTYHVISVSNEEKDKKFVVAEPKNQPEYNNSGAYGSKKDWPYEAYGIPEKIITGKNIKDPQTMEVKNEDGYIMVILKK